MEGGNKGTAGTLLLNPPQWWLMANEEMFNVGVLLSLFIYLALPSTPIAILAEILQQILLGEVEECIISNFCLIYL